MLGEKKVSSREKKTALPRTLYSNSDQNLQLFNAVLLQPVLFFIRIANVAGCSSIVIMYVYIVEMFMMSSNIWLKTRLWPPPI